MAYPERGAAGGLRRPKHAIHSNDRNRWRVVALFVDGPIDAVASRLRSACMIVTTP